MIASATGIKRPIKDSHHGQPQTKRACNSCESILRMRGHMLSYSSADPLPSPKILALFFCLDGTQPTRARANTDNYHRGLAQAEAEAEEEA